jgi:hypothetical protein
MDLFKPSPLTKMLVAVVGAAAYGYGYIKGQNALFPEIEKLQEQVNLYKNRNTDLNKILEKERNNVKIEYLETIKILKQKEKVYVQQAIENVPAQYNLSDGWVYLHDQAVLGETAEPARSSNAAPSGIEDNQALATVIENYGICQQNSDQLKSLQKFILEYNQNLNKYYESN